MQHSISKIVLAVFVTALVPSASLAQRLWVVDASGGGDFAAVQPAIDASADGDAIVIRAGTYGAFAVAAKALTISAHGSSVVTTGPISVSGISARSTLVLAGLDTQGGTGPALSIDSCVGSVRVLDSTLQGGAGIHGAVEDGWPGARLDASQDVAFTRCDLRGGTDSGYSSTSGNDAGHGLEARASRVALQQCRLFGGAGHDALEFDGGHGGSGTDLTGSFLFASGTHFQGGDGGEALLDCGLSGDGGDAIAARQTSVAQLLDDVYAPGFGGDPPGCGFCTGCGEGENGTDHAFGGGSTLSFLAGSARPFTMASVAFEGIREPFAVTAAPGSAVLLLASPTTGFQFAFAEGGVRLLSGPLFAGSTFLGIVPPGGSLHTGIELRRLASSLTSRTLHMQARLSAPASGWFLADANDLHVLPCVFGPDCDQNGIADACEAIAGTLADCDGDGVPDSCETADCNGNGIPDECDVASGAPDCDGNLLPDACDPDCNENGIPDACDIDVGTSTDSNGNGVPDECEGGIIRVYVDAAQQGPADGSSWDTAFPDLQDGIELARNSSAVYREIWVARGTYAPVGSVANHFVLPDRTELFGGFRGFESNLDERNPSANPTILSGDLAGDDGPDFANYADNSWTVVWAWGVQSPSRLDGFLVEAGTGPPGWDFPYPSGGMFVKDTDVVIEGCVFRRNQASASGALKIYGDSTPLVRRCLFEGNGSNGGVGGALVIWTNDPFGPGAVISECTFLANAAANGGAVDMNSCDVRVVDCLFVGNSASHYGGAINYGSNHHQYDQDYRLDVQGCTFAYNLAGNSGGALWRDVFESQAFVHDSILWGNTVAGQGGEASQLAGPFQAVTYSCIEGLSVFAGSGNIGSDPLFVDPDGADGIFGTQDDDLHLGPSSPCIDSGRNQAMPVDDLDLDADGNVVERWPFDRDGAPRFQDDPSVDDTGVGQPPIIDRGCYERSGG